MLVVGRGSAPGYTTRPSPDQALEAHTAARKGKQYDEGVGPPRSCLPKDVPVHSGGQRQL